MFGSRDVSLVPGHVVGRPTGPRLAMEVSMASHSPHLIITSIHVHIRVILYLFCFYTSDFHIQSDLIYPNKLIFVQFVEHADY